MSTKGLDRFKQDRDAFQLAVQSLEQSQSSEKQLTATLARAILESYSRIIMCAEESKPFIANTYANAPELFVALNLPWYTISQIPFLPTSEPYILDEIDEANGSGLGSDMCTLIRLGINNVESGRIPIPTAFIGLLSPCDGAAMLHQAIARNKDWRNIPVFCTDPPYFESDPDYHLEGIRDSLRRAAAHLPSVDAIGGSAAGVYVDNQVRVASLFRGVTDELFESRVKNIFIDLAHEWNDVPFRVVNDGDVTALAGAISLDDGSVLGLAMGTSTAVGYADESRNITDRISELAFVPLDYREDAPVDEWSGDNGCQVQYFSQQAVSRLIPASGLPIDTALGKPEQLVEVQKFMEAGDDRAAAIYRTIGSYLGYAIPHCAKFYCIRHLLLLGRVMTGDGGDLIIKHARAVLEDEFPELAKSVEISTPDEHLKRHGQAIAAASLPRILKN